MNLFVVSWKLPEADRRAVASEIRSAAALYPQLDPNTLSLFGAGHEVYGATLGTAQTVAAPRRYLAKVDSQLVFFDGLPIDRTGRFDAHDALELLTHWDRLSDTLEGGFVVIRVSDHPVQIDLLTDPLGMAQVFCLRRNDTWLVSNSVRLIERIGGIRGLDPLGVSLFLTCDWVGSDRTLRPDIRVLPGGQHVVWRCESREPSSTCLFPRAALAQVGQSAFTDERAEELGEALTSLCKSLGRSFHRLNCPLTGGRDSRLLAALLIHGEVPARYWTSGDPGSADVLLGKRLAHALGLKHQVSNLPTEEPGGNSAPSTAIIETWDDLVRTFVTQNDGLASVMLVSNILGQPDRIDRLAVTLSGLGGEIARYFYASGYVHATCPERLLQWLARHMASDHGGLVTQEAINLTQVHLRGFVQECLAEGFALIDVLDLFYAWERVRRWAGNYARELAPTEDQFMPFCTRPFIQAAFSVPAEERYLESIHRKLTHYLAPRLHDLPYLQPWRSLPAPLALQASAPPRSLSAALPSWFKTPLSRIRRRLARPRGARVVPIYDTAAWLESAREQIRDVCLSQSQSSMWDFVDRSAFERIMAASTDPRERSTRQFPLGAVATIGYYERFSSSP